MKAIELEKSFNPQEFEDRIYDLWTEAKAFEPANTDSDKDPFVVVIPPPNVTGVLHMGHGLNNSLQDIIIRYHRMTGKPTLWVPGTDHAGIATQNIVEKKLRERGLERKEIGREKFLEETWKVKEDHHSTITKQLKKIGASCDWSRERFTMDEGLSSAVRNVFVTLYERGLIYKGTYLVNWSSGLQTALSDDEVEFKEVQGNLYHIKYPYIDPKDGKEKFIQVATTRPETMLGDTAVAVNPKDDRYKHLVGTEVQLPLTGRAIKIIADDYVDIEFGTGFVKITPAHDPNDYEMGKRHNLEEINILNPDGTLNHNAPEKYQGMSVKEARKAVIADLEELGLFEKAEPHTHQVGHCYRTGVVIEPFLSDQWFVKMQPLAEKALQTWRDGNVTFYPKRWENTYTHWLDNIRDWCISRQLWWGHRIPVWYCDECGETIVSREDVTSCPKCSSAKLRQEEDVLDTWFSSWLWPFSTLGWPEKTDDLKRFFPTTALVTGYDIIFFWVARMIMAGMEFLDQPPFRDIYITGLVRDKQGRKMSKSLGNGIDPLDIVAKYGADAHKFTLAFLAAQGQDILLGPDDFQFGAKFANKIWNATRYILMNLEGRNLVPAESLEMNDVDKWIWHRMNEAAKAAKEGLEKYRYNDATSAVYEFFWNEFCDWYIESTKISLYSDDEAEKDRAVSMLITVLAEALKLLHPFMSFITEEIYQKLPNTEGLIITAQYPVWTEERNVPEIDSQYASMQELVRQVRTLRSEFNLPPGMKIKVHVQEDKGFHASGFFADQAELIKSLIGGSEFSISDAAPAEDGHVEVVGAGFRAYVFVKDVIDVPKEIERLTKSIAKAEKSLQQAEKKLNNPKFLENARPEVIEEQKGKQAEFSGKITKMKEYMEALKG